MTDLAKTQDAIAAAQHSLDNAKITLEEAADSRTSDPMLSAAVLSIASTLHAVGVMLVASFAEEYSDGS